MNEIIKRCSITKKAVQYYVEQGLVNPSVLENGYRDFSKEDVMLLKKNHQFKQTDEYRETPGYKLMTIMKEFCETTGYYDKFIPAMRRLSPLYNEYYEQMLKANDEFIKKYPEWVKGFY